MRVSRKAIFVLAAVFIGLASAIAVSKVEVENTVATSDTAAEPSWDGTTSLRRDEEKKEDAKGDERLPGGRHKESDARAQTWFGGGSFYLTAVMNQMCDRGAYFTGKVQCGVAVVLATLAGSWPLFNSFYHLYWSRGLEIGDLSLNGTLRWNHPDYPMLEASQTPNDGLPIHLGNTACDADPSLCFSIWYSPEALPRVTLHHVQLRPYGFDFRKNHTEVPSSGNVLNLRAGYMFKTLSQEALGDLLETTQSQFVDSISEEMNDLYESSGKYSREGCYCMDLATDYGDAATAGFFYYYRGEVGYPKGSEQGIYDICAKEAELKRLP